MCYQIPKQHSLLPNKDRRESSRTGVKKCPHSVAAGFIDTTTHVESYIYIVSLGI